MVRVLEGVKAGEQVVTKGSFALKSEMEPAQDRAHAMIASLLEFSLRQRILVIGLACLLSVAGALRL